MKCPREFSRRRTAPQGFTLIEIMIVIGIIGMVLAMGVPPFIRSLQKDPLRQAVSDITKGCSEARAQAILQGGPTEFVIRAGGQLSVGPARDATIESTAALGESAQPPVPGGPTAPPFSAHLHQDIKITLLYVNLKDQMQADETRVHFYPNGTSDEFTIILQFGPDIRKISLECVTGLANVESDPNKFRR
jgi:prepilin-type N-terminal cleavage/methylation domain-containing protein